MAASGLVNIAEAAAIEMNMKHKIPRVQLVKLKGIFHGNFENSVPRNGTDIAKCLEKLNGVLPKQAVDPYLKTSLANFTGLFGKDSFTNRLERSPSTDSIAISNFSSDQGSVDSCHYSSNGSDSNSGSPPCSPEEPEPHSPPLHTSCDEDNDRTESEDKLIERLQSQDSFYLQQDCSVPTFQSYEPRADGASCVDSEKPRSSLEEKLDSSQSRCPSSEGKSSSVSEERSGQSCSSSEGKLDSEKSGRFRCSKSGFGKSSRSHCSSLGGKLDFEKVGRSHCSSVDMQQCNWVDCDVCLEGNTELVEHIRTQHVLVQKDKESFVCLWAGCKVYDRSSCSLSWLERHILCHGGTKPFKCIVDSCSQRFPTQAALQRHVNSHFDTHNHGGGRLGKCRDDGGAKSFKKKKSAKFKKRSAVGKTEDFFDANVMEQIRYRLIEVHSSQPLHSTTDCGSITFHSKVRAVRTDKSGEIKILLHWLPENILPDCWVPEQELVKTKTIPFSSLPPQFTEMTDEPPRVKQRRK